MFDVIEIARTIVSIHWVSRVQPREDPAAPSRAMTHHYDSSPAVVEQHHSRQHLYAIQTHVNEIRKRTPWFRIINVFSVPPETASARSARSSWSVETPCQS